VFFWCINPKSSINLSQKVFTSMTVSAKPSGRYSMLTATMEVDNPHLEKLPVDFEKVAITVEQNDRFSLIDDEALGRPHFLQNMAFLDWDPRAEHLRLAYTISSTA
jgi:hypothetical protein